METLPTTKVKLWNNENILAKNKSLFLKNWHEKGIDYLCDMLDSKGNVYSYDFMSKHNFPVIHKEFLTMVKAIPNGLVHLMECHLSYEVIVKSENKCMIEVKCIYDPKCSNTIIRNVFQSRKRITPRGKFFWNSLIENINWKNLRPYLINIVSPIR